MKIIKKIGCMLLGVALLSANGFAEIVKEDTRITATGKSESLILGAAVSLSVTDVSTGSIVVLDDKKVEKDAVVKFDTVDLKKFKGLKVFETSITSYGYNEKELVTLIQRDDDGGVSEIISDTSGMPEKHLEFALGQLYEFFGKTDVIEALAKEQYSALTAKVKGAAKNITSEEDFVKSLENQVILTVAEKGTTEQIITNFEGILKVTEKLTDYDKLTSYQKETLFRNIAGDSYSSVEAMITALNEDITQLLKPASTGNTGGIPSGGGGGKKGASVSVTQPVVSQPVVSPQPEKEEAFSDMETAKWAQEAVDYLSGLGIINGYEDKTFRPDNNVTRAEFIKMLVQLTGVSEEAKISFGDVKETDWFYPYIAKANAAGFAKGDGVNIYPNNYITRQDMCVMCMNVLEFYGHQLSEEEMTFTDKEFVAEYAKAKVATLAEMKIVSGMPDGSFMPQNNTTRAEAANIIYKMWNMLEGM